MENKVLKILTDIQPEFNFNQAVNFIEEGVIDSFDMVNLVSTLDEKFGVSIDGVDVVPENFISVQAIVLLLKKKGVK